MNVEYICLAVFMFVCIIRIYVRLHVHVFIICIDVTTHVNMYRCRIHTYVCLHVHTVLMFACMHCTHVCMYVLYIHLYALQYVHMCICVHVYSSTHVDMYECRNTCLHVRMSPYERFFHSRYSTQYRQLNCHNLSCLRRQFTISHSTAPSVLE